LRVEEMLLSPNSPFADVNFDRDENGGLKYCLEASHSAARIIHWRDWTGKAITEHITGEQRGRRSEPKEGFCCYYD